MSTAYPDFRWLRGSKLEWLDGTKIDRAENGSVKARSLWPAARIDKVEIRHLLTDSQRATLDAFYSANRLVKVQLVSRLTGGVAIDALFTRPPEAVLLAPDRWSVSVELVGAS